MSEAKRTYEVRGSVRVTGTEDNEQIDWQVIAVFPERAIEASDETRPLTPQCSVTT